MRNGQIEEGGLGEKEDQGAAEPNLEEVPSPPKEEAPKLEVIPEPAPIRQPSVVA